MPRSFGLFALVVLFGISSGRTDAVLAQSLSSASVEGTVVDDTKTPIPGVSVTLTSPALQVGKRGAVTDVNGHYRFVDLPIGVYAVQCDLTGFRTVRREGLQLTAGFNARVDMDLAIGGVEESITVTGASPIVDTSTTQGGATIASTVYSTLPTAKTYTDVLRLTTGLTDTSPIAATPGMLGLGGIPLYSTYGNRTKYILMDGLDFNTVPTPDFGTAEQVDVRTYGNTAETQGPGAVINLLIKSGGNTFHGRSQFAFINDSLTASNLSPALIAQGLTVPQTLKTFTDGSTDLGGPVRHDRLWFYGAYRDRYSKLALPGFTETADPGSPAAYDSTTERTTTGKLSYQMTRRYQIIGLTQIEHTHESNATNQQGVGGGIGAFSNGDSRNTPAQSTPIMQWNVSTFAPQLRATPTDRLVFNVIGGYSGYHVFYRRQPGMENVPSSYDLTTMKYTGGNMNLYPRDATSQFWSTSGSLTYLSPSGKLGSHEVKTGWRQNRPWGGNGQADVPGRNGEPAGGNYVQIFDTIGGVSHQSSQIITYNYPWHSDDRNQDTDVYVSDRWVVHRRLTFNVGLRFDHFHYFVPEQTKPPGQFGISGVFPRVDKFKGGAVVPRMAVAWDVTGDAKTVVKGSFGIFALDPSPGNFNQNALVSTTYRWHDLNRDGMYDPGEVDLSYSGPDILSQVTPAGVTRNPDLRVPKSNEIDASIERELAASTALRILYVYHGYFDANDPTNPLRPYSAFNVPRQLPDPGPSGIIAPGNPLVTVWDYSAAYHGAAFQANQAVNRASDRNDHYNSVDMAFVRRAVGRWGFTTGLSVTKNHRWIVGTPLSPNDNYFSLDETWNWDYKANTTYRLPWDIFTGAIYAVRSGIYGQRTYVFRGLPEQGNVTLRLEPFGSEQLPNIHQLDLRVGKALKTGKTSTLDLSLDALNVLNISTGFSATYASGPRFGNVVSYSTPFVARLGAVFAF